MTKVTVTSIPKPSGSTQLHIQRRLEFPRMEDMRVRNVLDRMRLKYERQIPLYDPDLLHRQDIRPVEGKRSTRHGGYHTFAFKVHLRNGTFFLLEFWGAWVDIRDIPYRNPNWYQKYLKQRKIEYCRENNYPYLILQRYFKELEIEKFIRQFINNLRGGVMFAEPKHPGRYRTKKGTSFALWTKDHNDSESS